MVVPAVLMLYGGVESVIKSATHLRKMAVKLRDSLKSRFLGVYHRVKMAHSFDLAKTPFLNQVYLAAAVLDPNNGGLTWVDVDVIVADEDESDEIREDVKKEIKGGPMYPIVEFDL